MCRFYDAAANQVGDLGSQHLSKAEWNNLRILYLGTHIIIELQMKLEMLDAKILVKQIGEIWRF